MRRLCSIRSLFIAIGLLVFSAGAFAQFNVGVSVSFGPPELPVYEQPLCPGDGYIWTPGYWAWDGYDYYWVPATWVMVPETGFFWTPAWWGWGGSGYIFHEGYWGPRVGFYGGVNYGYGYFGHGYEGGRWDRGHFFYNRSVNNVNITEIHNVYNTTIVNKYGNSHVSYNGGRGGIEARPTSEEESARHQRHIPPVTSQVQHMDAARENPQLRAASNHGKPPVAATSRPAAFNERGAMPAKEGGRYNPTPGSEKSGGYPGNAIHPKELPANSRLAKPSTGDPNQDKRYQQQQQQLYQQQEHERQQLQQKQEQEHQQASQERQQQVEREHQQQTQHLAQQHYQQQVQMQQHQQPQEQARSQSHPQPHENSPKGKP